jgi:hypothetical protein
MAQSTPYAVGQLAGLRRPHLEESAVADKSKTTRRETNLAAIRREARAIEADEPKRLS